MKTGTTALQVAAQHRRKSLLSQGVRYPGKGLNHRVPLGALLGLSVYYHLRTGKIRTDLLDLDKAGVPPSTEWRKFKSEIDRDTTNRILISHEYLSQISDDDACRLKREIDNGRLYVAVTLRPPSAIVPSLWAQGLKDDGQTAPLDEWLQRVYSDRPGMMPARFSRAYDHGQLIERWSKIVGNERLIVIIADENDPEHLTNTFENMLGLPDATLQGRNEANGLSNRSLTAVEAEFFRQINRELSNAEIGWFAYHKLGRRGAMRQTVNHRDPPPDEPRVRLPQWAADLAARDGEKFAAQIEQLGVRVVGDLSKLGAPAKTPVEQASSENVPVDLGVTSVFGALAAGEHEKAVADKQITTLKTRMSELKKSFELDSHRVSDFELSKKFTTRQLAKALRRRLTHKLRTGKSMPIDFSTGQQPDRAKKNK